MFVTCTVMRSTRVTNQKIKKITAATAREKYHTAVHQDWLLSSHIKISLSLNSSHLLTALALLSGVFLA